MEPLDFNRLKGELAAPVQSLFTAKKMKFLICITSIFLINPIAAIAASGDSRRCVDERGYIIQCPEICTIEDNNGRDREVPCIDRCWDVDKNGNKIYFPCPPRD